MPIWLDVGSTSSDEGHRVLDSFGDGPLASFGRVTRVHAPEQPLGDLCVARARRGGAPCEW